MPPTGAGRVFSAVATATALGVGALQMAHVHGGLLTDYGADVFGTAWLYAPFRFGQAIGLRGRVLSPSVTAAVVFAGCALSEIAQRLRLLPGRYDPYDLVAFGATVLLCWLLDVKAGPFAINSSIELEPRVESH